MILLNTNIEESNSKLYKKAIKGFFFNSQFTVYVYSLLNAIFQKNYNYVYDNRHF